MKVAIYARQSVFKENSESLKHQIELCKQYLSRTNLNKYATTIYKDDDVSGKTTNREKYKQMMKDIRSGKIKALVCYKLDRVSRSTKDAYELIEELLLLNVDFISITEQFDTSTSAGRAQMGVASVFAQFERERTAERVKDNMLQLAKEGKWTGGITPTGFKSERSKFFDEDGKERSCVKLVQDKEGLELVKIVYNQYLNRGSISSVEMYMVKNGLFFKKGKMPSKSTIKNILHNPIYCKATEEVFVYLKSKGWEVYGEPNGKKGLLTYKKIYKSLEDGKEMVRKNWHLKGNIAAVSNVEGVISADNWILTQMQLERNSGSSYCFVKNGHSLLGGVLKCCKCGSSMGLKYGRVRKDGTRQRYYKCILKTNSRTIMCNSQNINAYEIEDAVFEFLENIKINKEEYFNNIIEKQEIDYSIGDTIKEKEKQINKLVEKVADDPELLEVFGAKIKALKKEKEQLEQQQEEQTLDDVLLDIKNIDAVLERMKDFKSLSKEDKRLLVTTICKKIVVDGKDIRISVAHLD